HLRGHRHHAVTDRGEGDHGGERVRVRSAQLSDPSVTVTFWNRSRYSSSVSTSSPGLCTSSPAWKPPSGPHGFCSTTRPSSLTSVTTESWVLTVSRGTAPSLSLQDSGSNGPPSSISPYPPRYDA